MAIANEKYWLLRHLDIMQASIQAHLDNAVYIILPADCGDMSGEVNLLEHALYGLRQAGRQWKMRLSGVLLLKTDTELGKPHLYMLRGVVDGEVTLIVCVHVDLVVTARDKEAFNAFYAQLLEGFLVP